MPVIADFLPLVYSISNRPDLTTETTEFITRAMKRAHFKSEYRFDIQTLEVPFVTSGEITTALPARFRKIWQVTGPNFRVHEVTPAALFDDNVFMPGKELITERRSGVDFSSSFAASFGGNTYYLAGSNINLRISTTFNKINVHYLQLPTLLDSFIAINFPEVITYMAAAYIFAIMKNIDKARQWAGLAGEIDNELIQSYFPV